jgi:hypothetical protein
MASLLTALITLACLCAGTVLGSLIRSRSPAPLQKALSVIGR